MFLKLILVYRYINYHFQVKKPDTGRTCSTYGETRGVYRVLVGKSEGRIPLGKTKV